MDVNSINFTIGPWKVLNNGKIYYEKGATYIGKMCMANNKGKKVVDGNRKVIEAAPLLMENFITDQAELLPLLDRLLEKKQGTMKLRKAVKAWKKRLGPVMEIVCRDLHVEKEDETC